MTLLLLALLAVATGLALDARRRLSAERERHAAEVGLARAGLISAHADTRDAQRVAAAWRAEAVRLALEECDFCGRLAEEAARGHEPAAEEAAMLADVHFVVTPREPCGDADHATVTNPVLHAVGGPADE